MSYPGGVPPQQGRPAPYPGQPQGQPGQFAPPGAPQVGQPSFPGAPGGVYPSGPPPGPYGQPAQFGGRPAPHGGPGAPYAPAGQQFGQPNPADSSGLVVDASYMPLTFILALTKPKILVNGQPVPNTHWGVNHIPVGPGQYHVRVSTPWLFDMGPAETTVPVNPGPGAKLYYRTPAIFFINGAIGPVPQKTPGMVAVYVVYAVAALLILLNVAMCAAAIGGA